MLCRPIARGLYRPNAESTWADDDVVLGFIGIVVEYGLFGSNRVLIRLLRYTNTSWHKGIKMGGLYSEDVHLI